MHLRGVPPTVTPPCLPHPLQTLLPGLLPQPHQQAAEYKQVTLLDSSHQPGHHHHHHPHHPHHCPQHHNNSKLCAHHLISNHHHDSDALCAHLFQTQLPVSLKLQPRPPCQHAVYHMQMLLRGGSHHPHLLRHHLQQPHPHPHHHYHHHNHHKSNKQCAHHRNFNQCSRKSDSRSKER